jgi:hypothetical protein
MTTEVASGPRRRGRSADCSGRILAPEKALFEAKQV